MNLIELLGFAFGVAGVWLTIKENVWCFPIGLVNVIISLYLFINQHLYSDAIQQGCYIFLLGYGWFNWLKGTNINQLPITKMSYKLALLLLFGAIGLSILMGSFFHHFTDADVPYIDASATALSFAAQYLIARKKIENWLIWIPVNLLYMGIYAYKGLYLYLLLFFIYFVLAIKGYLQWKKEFDISMQLETNPN